MSYTPPLGSAIDFVELGGAAPPLGGAVDFVEGAGGGPAGGVVLTLPIAVTVASAAVALELPLRVTVAAPYAVSLAVPVHVIDAAALAGLDGAGAWAASPDGAWRPVVVLDGDDVSARLVGRVTVTHGDDAAAIAELGILPDRVMQPMDLIGRPVRIAFARGDGTSEQTMFSGVVDVPSVDLGTGVITCICHDQAQEIWARTPREDIDALVGGRYSAAVSGEPADNFEYLRERIQSVGASWALDVLQRPRVLPWGDASRAVTVRTADVIDGSLSVELPSRDQLRSRVTVRLQYQYARLRYRGVQAQYSQSVHFFKPFLSETVSYPGALWLTTAMVKSACESVPGWEMVGEPYIEHPPARAWQIGTTISSGFYAISPAVAPTLALGFRCDFYARWQQRITEDYTVAVVWPAIEAQLGAAVGEEIGASLIAEFDQAGWESDATMEPRIPAAIGVGDAAVEWRPAGFDELARDEALRTLLDRAWVRMWSASRSGRVTFELPLRPDLWLDTRITLEHARLRAAGKITAVEHAMSPETGAATTNVVLAVGMPGATAAALPAWSLPSAPVDAYTPPLSAFSFEIGTYVGGTAGAAAFDPETMVGFCTNLNGVEDPGLNYYPHELSIGAPDIAAEDRDPRTLASFTEIAVDVPTDMLEIIA